MDVLERLELFGVMVDAERRAVAAELRRLLYAAHDVVFRKGESADSLYILARGRVRVVDHDASGRRIELAELAAPAYFGEMGLLTGQPRLATVIAIDDAVCYQLGKAGFDAILQAGTDAALKALDAAARAKHAHGGAGDLLRRIRHFFALPGDPG